MSRALLAALLALLWPAVSAAHSRSISYSTWQLEQGRGSVVVRLSALDASALEQRGHHPRAGVLARHVRDSLRLSDAAGSCAAGEPRERVSEPGWVELEWSVTCPDGRGLRLESRLLFSENPTHLHLARFGVAGGASEHVLDAHERSAVVEPVVARADGFLRFVALGVEHIATGWDHLLFLAMLLVFAKKLRQVAWVVSGFTLGHSISLSLAASGAVVPQEAPVEALIAASIGLVAVENVWLAGERRSRALPLTAVATLALATLASYALARPVALALLGTTIFSAAYFGWMDRSRTPEVGRTAVVALFGLVHGFGFARAVAGLDLEPARLWRALVGFNLGVELGQLVAVVAAWPALVLLRRREQQRVLVPAAATGALGLACYWLVRRAFGG